MRWFFYSSSLVISLVLFVNDASAALIESCPYGYRNVKTTAFKNGEDPGCGSTCEAEKNKKRNLYGVDTVFEIASSEIFHTVDFGDGNIAHFYELRLNYVTPADCAITPTDSLLEGGCYPGDIGPNSEGLNTCFGQEMDECSTSSGGIVEIVQGKKCSDYCEGDNPATSLRNEPAYACSGDERPPLSGPDDPTQCPIGQIYDELTGGCLDDCNGFPCDDPGDDPDDDTGDDDSDNSGGGSSGGDSDGDDTGGDIPDGSDDGGSGSSCDSSATCLDEARTNESCDYDRDMEYYTYVSGSQYFYECQYCNGPASSSYDECNLCDFGYNGDTGACYPVTCPFGDCTNPNENNQTPKNPSDDDNTQVVAAIRDLQAEIANGVDVNQLPDLINIVESFKTQNSDDLEAVSTSVNDNNDDNTQLILDALGDLKTAVEEVPGASGSGDGPGNTPETNENCQPDENGNMASGCVPCEPDQDTGKYPAGCSDTELKDLLKKIVDIQEDIRCSVSNYSPGEEEEGAACPSPESDEEFSHEGEAGELYAAFGETAWGGVLTSLETAAQGVSGSCTLDYSIFVPIADREITVEICRWLDPISNTLRAFAIAIWGLLGIRHIFSA